MRSTHAEPPTTVGSQPSRRYHPLHHSLARVAHASVDPLETGAPNLGISSVYLRRIVSSEIIAIDHGRPIADISANADLQMSRPQANGPDRTGADGPADASPSVAEGQTRSAAADDPPCSSRATPAAQGGPVC